jgi:hypothetical protein
MRFRSFAKVYVLFILSAWVVRGHSRSAREYAAAQRILASRHRFVRKISHTSFKRQTTANFFV